jgi:hypothetical protein
MALTYAQIVSIACQVAKCPGYTSQAGALLNTILGDLNQTHDFDVCRAVQNFNFDTNLGSGPYPLAADYLRTRYNEMWYTINGVKYVMIQVELFEFDAMVQQAGLQSYPTFYATDMSPTADGNPPVAYFWAPPSGAYPVTNRYQRQMPVEATPETSTNVPWFPNQQYLLRRLEAELMTIVDDSRQSDYMRQAEDQLRDYIKLKDDKEGHAQTVQLDRRQFSNNFSRLPNTKSIGW